MVEIRRSYCRFCVALCGIDVEVDGDRVLKVRGAADDPLSAGYTCPKGRALPAFHHHPSRLDRPSIRRDGTSRFVSWEDLFADLGARLTDVIDAVGPDGVAVYLGTGSAFNASGRRVADRFVRAIGSRSKYASGSLDAPCKPMIAEMMAGHAGLNPTIDWERTTLTILIGSNPVVSHGHVSPFVDPVRTLRSLESQGELWVIDPRRTETAALATRHLAPRPGTDDVVLAHLVRELLRHGADAAYVEEYTDPADIARLRDAVERFDLETAASITGIDATDLTDLVEAVRRHGRLAGLTGTGATMSAAANCTEWLLWALLVVTGSYDRPGGMWFNPGFLRQLDTREWTPATGSPEPGPASRSELPRWIGEYPAAALLDEIDAGNVRALIVVGGNPVTAFPEVARLEKTLQKLDVLAVADVVATPTTELATHVLPSTGQLERPDLPHFIDQFHPIVATRYTEAVVEPVADRKALWWIIGKIGASLGIDVLPKGIDFESSDVDLLAGLADRSRAGSFAAVRSGGVDNVADPSIVMGWVLPRLPDGRWRIAPEPLVRQLAGRSTTADTGLALTPRREVRHLNSALVDLPIGNSPLIVMHPEDAARCGLTDGAIAHVRSVHGTITGPVRIAETVREGVVSIPHGFESMNVGSLASLTFDVDPLTGMVLLTGVPIEVAPAGAGP